MTDDRILPFPDKKPKKRKPIHAKDVEQMGFLTKDDRDLWISDPHDVLKIMKFIVSEKIQIYEDKKTP